MLLPQTRLFDQDRYQRLFEKGVNCWHAGALDEAKSALRTILRDKPNHSETLRFLGLTIRKEGQLEVARDLLARALRADPKNAGAMVDLANVYVELNNLPQAQFYAEMAHAIAPDLTDVHANFGLVAMRLGQDEAAIKHFERALELDPHCMVSEGNLATCRQRVAPPDQAVNDIDFLLDTVERDPKNGKAHLVLSIKLETHGKYSRALLHAYESCKIEANAGNLSQLASFMCALGDFEEAMPLFEQGVALSPYAANPIAAYLFALNYCPKVTPEKLHETYMSFAQKFLNPKKKFRHLGRKPVAGRKLRIAYSSPDFRTHSMFNFITPILAEHDRSRFEIFAYSNTDLLDAKSEIVKGHVDHWVDVTRLSDEEMAQRIVDDGIDVLVDLAGHSRGNRLGVFAMRAAPVQASYLGYGYTTGLSEIDYFIGDENLTPPGSERYFAEKVWRVPAPAYIYRPPPSSNVDVSPVPALTKGYVTFGTMSRLIRLNDGVLRTWKAILDRVPNSKLRVDALLFQDHETRELSHSRFLKLGFRPEQLEMGLTQPHWNGYAHFDMSLDCWPHNTGTTILDSLWMGVPVLSKLDRPSVGRFGATFLKPMGLEDWLVEDVPSYIEKAVAFANDLPRLVELRASLRDRLAAHALMQPHLMTGKLETFYAEAMQIFERKKAA